jgi:pyrroline-5-carboxylate reductase
LHASTHSQTIAFIGAGNMASALIQGLIRQGSAAGNLLVADIDTDKLQSLAHDYGIRPASEDEIAAEAEIIVLAVKPQVMESVCASLGEKINQAGRQPLIISVAAGITLASLDQWLGGNAALVRCMPNTPALIGKGASGLYANARVDTMQRQASSAIMEAVGLSVWVEKETDLDAVTAVSGSGPAYFFLFMEAMQDAARDMGLEADLARSLVLQTAMGAAELAAQSKEELAELRRRVTSPGGTTEQAIKSFQADKLEAIVAKALQAARRRSEELAAQGSD